MKEVIDERKKKLRSMLIDHVVTFPINDVGEWDRWKLKLDNIFNTAADVTDLEQTLFGEDLSGITIIDLRGEEG